MNKGDAADSLWLRTDGQFVHRYLAAGSAAAIMVDSGAWLAQDGRELRVELADYVDRSRGQTKPTYWSTYARRASGGRPSLVVDGDLGWEYVRVADVQ